MSFAKRKGDLSPKAEDGGATHFPVRQCVIGMAVRFQGLKSRSDDLNGQMGVVRGVAATEGRFVVRSSDGELCKVKPGNFDIAPTLEFTPASGFRKALLTEGGRRFTAVAPTIGSAIGCAQHPFHVMLCRNKVMREGQHFCEFSFPEDCGGLGTEVYNSCHTVLHRR